MSAIRMPFRQRIAEEIKAKIRSGEYQPGHMLPSRPALAAEFGCSVEPVIRAQEDLERDGWIEIHHGKGVFVADRPPSAS